MSILVTGGAGFIGGHLINQLLQSRAERVICLDKLSPNSVATPAPRLQFVEGDIRDRRLLDRIIAGERVSHVVHLAASVNVRAEGIPAGEMESINVQGTENILAASLARGVRKVVQISSSSVYGAGADAPFREDAPLGRPLSAYAASKRQAEELCVLSGQQGLPITRLRLFNVYGPKMRGTLAIAVFLHALRNGLPIPVLGDGSARRDLVHVSDICRGIQLAITRDSANGEAINLGTGTNFSVLEVIRILRQMTRISGEIHFRSRDSRDLPETLACTEKARRLLGFSAQISLRDGLRSLAAETAATWKTIARANEAAVPG